MGKTDLLPLAAAAAHTRAAAAATAEAAEVAAQAAEAAEVAVGIPAQAATAAPELGIRLH
jgi:hypothetical protein